MGPMTTPEKRMSMLFAFIASCWILRTPIQSKLEMFPWLSDTLSAVAGAILMFVVPSGSNDKKSKALLDWKSAEKLPWGVLLLFK